MRRYETPPFPNNCYKNSVNASLDDCLTDQTLHTINMVAHGVPCSRILTFNPDYYRHRPRTESNV